MERSILHMHLISGIGPATIMYLYNALAGDVSSIYWYTENDVQRLGIRKHTAQALVSGLRETRALYHYNNRSGAIVRAALIIML